MKISHWKAIVAVIVLVSLAGKLYVISQTDGLWWDEAVYIGLGRALSSNQYTLDPELPLESFRPPMTPLITSSFYWSAQYSRALIAFISLLSVLAAYYLGKEVLGEDAGLLAAAFTATSHIFVFFSAKLMSEPLFIIFFSLSLIFFSRWTKRSERWDMLLCGIFAGAAFMTRYLAYALVLAYIIYFLAPLARKKKPDVRSLSHFLAGFVASLVPWFWIGYVYYGNPVGSFITNLNIWTFSFSQTFLEGLSMMSGTLNYVWIFLAIGLLTFYQSRRKRRDSLWICVAVLAISVAFFLGSSHKEARYLLSFMPAYVLLAAFGAERVFHMGDAWKRLAVAAICVLSVASLAYGLSAAWEDRHSASGLYYASQELAGLAYPGEYILTQSYPYVYMAGMRAVNYCDNYVNNEAWEACQAQIIARTWEATSALPLLEKYNITYILSSKFELMNPARTVAYFNREFEKVKSWEQWGDPDAIAIYRVNVTSQA